MRTPTEAEQRATGVLLVSASMGAGHDGVAFELARRLRAAGVRVQVVDYLTLLPLRLGRVYRRVYEWQLRRLPSSYEWLYTAIDKPGPLDRIARFLCALGRGRLRRVVHGGGYTLAISTYPMATQALGSLRRRRRLRAHAVSFLTDADAHSLWLHPWIDDNLTVWPSSAAAAVAQGGTPATAVGPVLPPEHAKPVSCTERAQARERLGLSRDRVALVAAGSWGVGDVLTTARALHDSGAAVPLVLCGRNEELRRQLDDAKVGVAVGWTSDVRTFLAAADVLVHNAGGLCCLEAYAAGVPVIGFACLPGHGRRNAAAMAESDTAALADDAAELVHEVLRLAASDEGAAMAQRASALFTADPTERLVSMASWPVPKVRRSVTAVAAVVAMSLGTLWAVLTVGVAQATDRGVGVAHARGAVYLAVQVDAQAAADPKLAAVLREARASLAIGAGPRELSPLQVRAFAAAGVSVVAVDGSDREHDPADQGLALIRASGAVRAATGEARPPVAVLHRLSPVELAVAWGRRLRLARPATHGPLTTAVISLDAGDQIVLDERGRSASQIARDLGGLDTRGVRVRPLRSLWPGS